MRPLIALLLAVAILGSLALFFRLQSAPAARSTVRQLEQASGRFDIQVMLTFDAGPDAFALSSTGAPSLIIEFLGDEILRRNDDVEAGTPITIENIEGVTVGNNSFFVRCTAKNENAEVARAIRVRVLRDQMPVAEQTIWSAAGGAAEGLVEVDVPAAIAGNEDHEGDDKSMEKDSA